MFKHTGACVNDIQRVKIQFNKLTYICSCFEGKCGVTLYRNYKYLFGSKNFSGIKLFQIKLLRKISTYWSMTFKEQMNAYNKPSAETPLRCVNNYQKITIIFEIF